MEGQRQRAGGGRRRRRKARQEDRKKAPSEPVLIAARRPDSPLMARPKGRGVIAASARPKETREPRPVDEEREQESAQREQNGNGRAKRAARIIQVATNGNDDRELERQRLLDRLLASEGRGAITKVADAYIESGFEFPISQEVQLQLLEHNDEARARSAIETIQKLLSDEPPLKKPILDQRLRRLEEYADEAATRDASAALRRAIR